MQLSSCFWLQLFLYCEICQRNSLFFFQGDDLTTYGDIVLEGELRLQGAKNDRLIFLFDKMILVTKRQDGFLVCKANIKVRFSLQKFLNAFFYCLFFDHKSITVFHS